ncbi:LysR substrate-binding domain-containing protein [Bordetella sp. 2513F-2]
MSRIPLNTLPVFRTVAELQNLRAAAARLHLTHSAVSQQIRGLEHRLGFPLFERRGRGVALNAAGTALLHGVQAALDSLDAGLQAAEAAARGSDQTLRVSVLPSFAQRWLLPRMGRWRQRHPSLLLEIEASQNLVDLRRDGFHAALRFGRGPWAGLLAEPLLAQPLPMIVLASPQVAMRLRQADPGELAREPLLGEKALWQAWFAAAGVPVQIMPVATFNDAGMLLQAAEHGLGLALAREILAADALASGRLVKLSDLSIPYEDSLNYHLVYRPELQAWPPLRALRDWLHAELRQTQEQVNAGESGTHTA